MKILDWVAILGALAWVPHLIKFVRDLFTRPSIRLYTQKRLMVGFNTLGPIIYLKIAFVVKNKDLVVSGMRFRLKHQDGDEKVFVWQEIVQTFGTHTYPAVSVPFQKQSDVLAIKAKESEVEDRFISFQDESFVERWRDLWEKAMEKQMHLRRQGKTDEEFLMSVEMSELRTFNERSFSWKEGKYELHFELDSPQKFRLSGNSYQFSLSSVRL